VPANVPRRPELRRARRLRDTGTGPNGHHDNGITMNSDRFEGNWKQLKGKVREQWGRLTDDHVDQIAGKRDQLVGRVQEAYGIERDEAERQVSDWESRQPH
jgi:uncharacterized protein YjbJ (UPF0337 family)